MPVAGNKKKKILVVEDEPAIARVCSMTLAGEGFEVHIAANGSLANDILDSDRDYDLIIIDIRTPVMNGKQLYKSINEKHPELADKVIFTTGDILGGDTEGFLKKSGRMYLSKPFTPEELKAAVKNALKRMDNEDRKEA